jgi:GT2 family glycosyltransferase
MKPLVSVLILTYNRTDLLGPCLESALASDYLNLEFIVSDNASSEDIRRFVRKNFSDKRIKVVRLENNKGLTGGFNFGYKFCHGKYVMLLSNDTVIERKSISAMVHMLEQDISIGIAAPKIIQMKNKKILHNAGSFFTYSGLLYHYGVSKDKDNPHYQKSYYTFSANGAGFMIRKAVSDHVGLFAEDFFMSYDDSDLSHRVWLAGYSVVYCPKGEIYHLWGATATYSNPRMWFLSHRNKFISFMTNLSLKYLLLECVSYSLVLFFWLFYKLYKRDVKVLYTVPQTYIWLFTHFAEIVRKRRYVQKEIRKVTDNQIFEKCFVSPSIFYYLTLYAPWYKDKELPKRVFYTLNGR